MKNSFDEQTLAKLCSEHNRQAEDDLYIRYAARVFALCLRYCENREDAQDLLQETFIKVFGSIGTFVYKGEGSLSAWICRVAINLALNKLKKHRFSFLSFDLFHYDIAEEPPEELVSSMPEEILMKMISELKPMRRAVFNMYCIDGYSHKDIASALGITEKGSASILSKAKAQLKDRIKEYIKQTK